MAKPSGEATVTRADRLPRRPARRRPVALLALVVLLLLLVAVVDRGSAAVAQHELAVEIRKQGFPSEPEVAIKGIPFLTQVLSRDFRDVRLEADGIIGGPVRITSLKVRARNVRVDSGFQRGVLGSVDGTAFIGFGDLAKAGGDPGLELTAGAGNRIEAKVDLGITEATATASVTKEGDAIRVRALSAEGHPLDDLDGALDFTVPVKGLPLGLAFRSLTVSSGGVSLHVTGRDVPFG
ncbi:LmeA family phospholipid-binding protein [Actinomadura bangladeshensis]|uniref:DUF2993 domain-containing protein n=1 Tax=Actinomadura bangladeshensis TaxID=453573 RepID=A0A4R4NVL3_9ACTN|nr:DUF2993 domain-containing protein [Actinomadura bangladeshensis]TDC12150.1 DUF2993 domain-containing protein [Actinomadura bangladeshensis]